MAFFYQVLVIFCVVVIEIFAVKHFSAQPKLYVTNGNLHIYIPEDKNVQFYTSGFHVNDHELLSTLKGAENATKLLQNYENFISQYNSKIDVIENKLLNIRPDSLLANTTTNATIIGPSISMKLRRIDRRLNTLQRTISSLKLLLVNDDCASNPCKNGGVCLDMYNAFLCQCQNGWEGSTCENDIDECTRFKGTDLGCQNGGTCQNLPGTYQCYCQNGWVGIHCNRRPTDCSSGGTEICGHGTCVPQNNDAGYKCICDVGWTTDGSHKSCSVDVDECKLNHPPCSTNPLVLCTNVPGSFVCQHCPPGYTGNGYYCADVNECELFNGGCSVSPFAECINVPGSSKCGPCPPGYQGNGKICSYKGVCNINNGGCSLLARCEENPEISESSVQCICPRDYAGSGIGPNGCYVRSINSTSCSSSPCVHGTCVPNNSPQGFSCLCDTRHSGTYCEREDDPCATNPCLNGGTCQKRRGKFSCKCPSGFSGKLCNKERQGCGESINQANGTLSYPPTDYSFTRGSEAISCAWTISTDDSMVIQINFTKFNVVSDSSCSSQWFQIHDGKNSMAPPLGRYCGNIPPLNGSINTTHNIVYIWLRSNGQSNIKPEFEIKWNTKKPDCGGRITGGNGIITSPGWPSNYPNNRDCFWYFMVPTSKRLLFHIYSMNIGHDSDCTGDFLEFYGFDMGSSYRQLQNSKQKFASFCNSTIPEPFYSTSYLGQIHFKSNEKDTYSGFQLGYSTVNGIPGCGGTYTGKNAYIQSIEMSSSMPTHLTCVYEIKLPANTTIKLEIVELNLEENCEVSSIAIYEGSSRDSGLIERYCGSTLPGAMTRFGSNFLIKSTSTMYHKNHWKMKYETICTRRFTDPVGSISFLYGLEECSYYIERPIGNIITLNLELTGRYYTNKECIPYYVEVRDGDSENSTLIDRYCTPGDKVRIDSTANYLWIKVRLSLLHRMMGFTANYTAVDIGCGGILKKASGTISFPPQGSGKYIGNHKCRWIIVAPNDNVIQLNWMTFNLEHSFECTYDNVKVFDNNTGDGMGGPMGKFCGFKLPPVMTSTSNVMTIDFSSDTTVHGDGFLVSYIFIRESHVCGAQYFTSAGVVKSPGYPNDYPTNRECIWVITVPPGYQIMLNVTDFNLESYSSCRYDWLEIRNGGTSSSSLIKRYCGTTIPKLIPSHANQLFLKFNSDMSRTSRGFRIQWSSAATGCGGSLISPSGSIMSPHYPEPYTKSTDCLWKIVVSAGSKIQIIFADMDLEKHSTCALDFIQIFDGPTINSKSLGKFCSPQTTPIISSANNLLVRFRSDVSFQGRGFNIQYSTICTNTLTGFGGVIESPNFPNDYPQDQNCLWDIIVSEKNKINITFSHFALERSTTFQNKSCQFDYVEIEYQTDTDSSMEPIFEKYDRYCGQSNPGLITLNANHARVHFVSDSLLLGTGFRIEWQLFGCGGVLTDTTGLITSPNYPRSYPPSVECNWIITVPLGQSISIQFTKIDVEKDSSCRYDSITLYNGKDDTYQQHATLCYQINPITITSTGNNMFVHFKADFSYQGLGFIATYQTEPTTCGGRLTAPIGYVFSPNYPKNYNKNETCEWLISTEEHHLIQLQFEDVDLIKGDCNKTYIKIYDGPTQAYPLIKTVCGTTQLNETIKSTFENLFIEFRGDLYTSKGFKAKYQRACGGTITTSESGTLEISRHFIATQTEEGGNCTYTIQAEDKSKHITLTITRLRSAEWCDEEYNALTVYNGPFSTSPVAGKFCGPKLPTQIVSDGSALHLEFIQSLDFFATYTVLDDQCGGDLEGHEGFFATPGFPKTYPSNIQCTWTISMGPGNTINLHVLNFDIPESDNCNTDFLEIRDTNATGKILGVHCGTDTPTNLTTDGKMYLIFKSSTLDEGVATTNKGFKAEYAISTENNIFGQEGLIGNPNYPGSTGAFGSYTWLITTKPRTIIEISFIRFFMETDNDEEDCSGSFTIYDGMDTEADNLGVTCGTEKPASVLSSSNMVFISFAYYSSRLDSKFLIKWRALTVAKKSTPSNTTSACQVVYTLGGEENQTISSPGYPYGYAPSLNCEWIFETPPQYHLEVKFKEINFGSWSKFRSCTFTDVIRVYQRPNLATKWEMVKEFCNNSNTIEEVFGAKLMKIQFETNKYLNGTGFQAQVFAVCGGTLTEPTGDITFNNSISHERECQWNITVKSGRTIKLRFEQIDLNSNDPNNCKNYVLIRNGKFADSPYLGNGKFCGPDIDTALESSSNHLYIKYTGEADVKGFKIKYEEVSIDCGQHYQLSLENPSVEIWSPNYPNIPQAHIECIWTFRAPTGEALRVDFEERFDISDNKKCLKDYLELRDGGTELASPIGTYCYATPSTKFTTDNMLRMKFFTDSDEPRNGFKAKVSISYCGGTFRGLEGTLSSKEPHNIRGGSNCTWYLKANLGYHYNITFQKLNVFLYNPNCSRPGFSRVSLYEHSSIFGNDTDLGTYCGNGKLNITMPITTSTNEVVVNYISKSDQDEFSLKFEAGRASCGGNLNQESGTITSPGYPHFMHDDRYCFWRIQVPKGRRITMIAEDVDFDHTILVIFQGYMNGPQLLPGSKLKSGMQLETSDNGAHMLFWQPVQSNKRGFKLTFSSDKPSVCSFSGDFNQTYGALVAPPTTDIYRCEWEHTKRSENETLGIKVMMETNITKLGSSCARATTGLHMFSDNIYIANICENTIKNPMVIRSPYSRTVLIMRKNAQSELNFTISYKSYKCGGLITDNEAGTISSPNFPNSPRASMECSWRITLDSQHKVKINVTTVNLGNDCEKSYLIIYNGHNARFPQVKRYCKNSEPELIISQTNAVVIEYKYEEGGDGSSKGFMLSYEPEIHGCGGIYQRRRDVIQTPHYSLDYPNNAECIWEIRAEEGNLIKFNFFNRFHIEESENCANDYVEIFDWKDDNWISLGKKCGRTLPKEISSSTQLRILFRSNDKITGSGFTATWEWHCGGELEATKQERYLMNPGYPNTMKANCTYKIVTKKGKGIVYIGFLDFDLDKGADCSKSNLTIAGKVSGRAININRQVFCGKTKPPNQRFQDSVVVTYINSQNVWNAGAATGFKLVYKDESCGGNISSPTVIEVSNTFTDTAQLNGMLRYYQPRVSCSWYVTAPTNQIAVLSIEKLRMSLVINCLSQSLDVFEGLEAKPSKRLATLCGEIDEESKPIPSTSNNMLIKLETAAYNFEGFKAEIYFTYGPSAGCGGTINLTETKYLKSPNNLPHMDCHWIITAPRDQKVQLEFTKIKISGACDNPVRNHTYFCTCSYIEVRDGGGPFADAMPKLCSSDSNTQRIFTTSWNTAFLRLYSAVSQNDVFSVTLTPVQSKCGPSNLIVTKELQELKSPNYPNAYPSDIKCTWVLTNPTLQGRIVLHFEDFDLLDEPSSQTCDDDRLKITDDPHQQIISEGYGPTAKYHMQLPIYSRGSYSQYSFCGKDTKPFDFKSVGNVVTLSFQSYASGEKGKGFKLKYGSSGCNRTINANEGRIENQINDQNNCIITIIADENKTLSIYFLQFHIPNSVNNCSTYGFEIRENNSTGPQLLQACGHRVPNPVFSNSNQLYIRAYNQRGTRHVVYSQFNFMFIASEYGKGCGGKLYNFMGKFSSPMYPNVYRENIECTWDVQVPRGFKVAFTFSAFDIVGSCSKNKVVVTTYTNDRPTEHIYCAQDTPATLYSDINLQITYYSSVNNGGTGWLATFQAVKHEGDKIFWF